MPRIYQLPNAAALTAAHRVAVDAAGNVDAESIDVDAFRREMPGAIIGQAASTAPGVSSSTEFAAIDAMAVGWISDGRDVTVEVEADVIGTEDTRGEIAVFDAGETQLAVWPFFVPYGSSIVPFHRSVVLSFPAGPAAVRLMLRVVFGTSVKFGLADEGFGPHTLTVKRG